MQRDSTKLPPIGGGQLSLIPERKIVSAPVSLDYIPRLKDTRQAIEYACNLANAAPKELFGPMGYEKTKWSRICTGERDLPGRDIPKFCRVVDNTSYLLFLNHDCGYDLLAMRKRLDDKDRRIAELEGAVAERDRALELVVGAMQKGRG